MLWGYDTCNSHTRCLMLCIYFPIWSSPQPHEVVTDIQMTAEAYRKIDAKWTEAQAVWHQSACSHLQCLSLCCATVVHSIGDWPHHSLGCWNGVVGRLKRSRFREEEQHQTLKCAVPIWHPRGKVKKAIGKVSLNSGEMSSWRHEDVDGI